MVQLQPNLI